MNLNKLYMTGIIIILTNSACDKGSSKGPAAQPETKILLNAPEFEELGEWTPQNLSMNDRSEFQIRVKKSDQALPTFKGSCDAECPQGISVSNEGLVVWEPSQYRGEVPASFRLKVQAISSSGSESSREFPFAISKDEFRIGDSWDRKIIADLPQNFLPSIQKLVLGFEYSGTSKRGTVIYLGVFNNLHLVLSSANFLESTRTLEGISCGPSRNFVFPYSRFVASCESIVFKSETTDFAIFSVKPRLGDGLSNEIGKQSYPRFMSARPALGEKLVPAGFGAYKNPYGDLTFGTDDSCMAFTNTLFDHSILRYFMSETGLLERRMTPQKLLAAPCEASSNDLGGPLVSLKSNLITGIMSDGATGHQVKNVDVTSGLEKDEEARRNISKVLYVPSDLIFSETNTFSEQVGTSESHKMALKKWLEVQFDK